MGANGRSDRQALASPEADIEAITLTFGNTTLDYARSNLLRLANALQETSKTQGLLNKTLEDRVLGRSGQEPIPVALGAEKPLGGRMFTASYFHGRDGMSGVSMLDGNPYPELKKSHVFRSSDVPAPDMILDVLRKHPPNTVRIAAIGPLTNLALAYKKDPATFRRVGMISAMGGALDLPGNASPCAEFNFFADPWAAKLLLEDAVAEGGPLPVHLLPLDITLKHRMPYSLIVREKDDPLYQSNFLVRMVSAFMRKPRAVTNSFAEPGEPFDATKYDLFEAHDPLAVAHAVFYDPNDAASAWQSTPRDFLIETDGRLTRGMCVVDRRKHGTKYQGRNKAELEEATGPHNEHGLTNEREAKRAKTEAPVPGGGGVQVLAETPGSAWFADLLLDRLFIEKP